MQLLHSKFFLAKKDKIIIKAKNFICGFLYNYYSLEEIHLGNKNGDKLNTLNILKKLKNYTISSDLLRKEKIPYEWYIDSIIEYMKKLQNISTHYYVKSQTYTKTEKVV